MKAEKSIVDVQGIVAKYLSQHGYDGLYDVYGDCSCAVDALAPCGEMQMTCKPGYKHPCNCGAGCDFHMGADKPKAGPHPRPPHKIRGLNP